MSDSADREKRPGGRPGGGRPDRGGPAKGAPKSGARGPRAFGDGAPARDGGQRNDRPARSSDRNDRPARSSDRDDRPARSGDRTDRPARSGDRVERPSRFGDRSDRPVRSGDRNDRGAGRGSAARDRGRRDSRPPREDPSEFDPYGTRSVRSRHDDPIIPGDVQPAQLDRVARAQLKTLTKENADVVASHLVMAARLIDSDPELAHRHAVSAARKAGRIAVVRESLAITAYMIGDFALALRELRTYRRISGRDDQLPMMVDCERGLGRPDRALELGRSVPRSGLPTDVQVELAIAMSGARLDLGQTDAALAELEIPQLDPARAFSWSPALFAAYATVLEELGRASDAEKWFERAQVAQDALDGAGTDEDEDVVEIVEEELAELPEGDDAAGEPGGADGSD